MKFENTSNVICTMVVLVSLFSPMSYQIFAQDNLIFEEIDPAYYETDVGSFIQIKTEKEIVKKRKELVKFIWGKKGFPDSNLPTSEKDIKDNRYVELENLKQIDKLTVTMDYGLISIIYHFIPKKSNNKLMLYHQGHNGDFIHGKDVIAAFINKGYSVMAFSMPLLGMNNQPVVELKRFGKLKLTKHDHLKFLDHPIKYFIEPITTALNYAEKLNYDAIHMIGISGGGWTTTLCAAIDTRIMRSYPVAGTYPIYLRSNCNRDWGDYEQTVPELYAIANYLELYIMGSYGKGRKQFQMLNKYDSCCFAGIKYRTYEKTVKEIVARLGKGEFEIFLDDSHKEHKISDPVLKVVFKDLEDNKM